MKFFIVVAIISLGIINQSQAKEIRNYQPAKLVDIQIQSRHYGGYDVNTYNSSTSNVSVKSRECKGKKCSDFSFSIPNNSTLTTVSPSATVKNTYFFFINTNGFNYVVSFEPIWRSKIDTNWVIGSPISVSLNQKANRMYILKPNGGELKTRIIRITPIDQPSLPNAP